MLCLVTCNLQLTCVDMLKGGGGGVMLFLACCRVGHIYIIVWYKIWSLFLALLTVILDYRGSLGGLECRCEWCPLLMLCVCS
jgi:hypothetical protein